MFKTQLLKQTYFTYLIRNFNHNINTKDAIDNASTVEGQMPKKLDVNKLWVNPSEMRRIDRM